MSLIRIVIGQNDNQLPDTTGKVAIPPLTGFLPVPLRGRRRPGRARIAGISRSISRPQRVFRRAQARVQDRFPNLAEIPQARVSGTRGRDPTVQSAIETIGASVFPDTRRQLSKFDLSRARRTINRSIQRGELRPEDRAQLDVLLESRKLLDTNLKEIRSPFKRRAFQSRFDRDFEIMKSIEDAQAPHVDVSSNIHWSD